MNTPDIAEALVAAALTKAGYTLKHWDTPIEGFDLKPDLHATFKKRHLFVQVNISSSPQGLQKKFWRNIIEPFETKEHFGPLTQNALVTFTNIPTLSSQLPRSHEIFDAICPTSMTQKQLNAFHTLLENIAVADKQSLCSQLTKTQKTLPHTIRTALSTLITFFKTLKTQNTFPLPPKSTCSEKRLHFTHGLSCRKNTLRAAILGTEQLHTWQALGLGTYQRIHIPHPTSNDEHVRLERASQLNIDNTMCIQRSLRGYHITVADELHALFAHFGAANIVQWLEEMTHHNPGLTETIEDASDPQKALQKASAFKTFCQKTTRTQVKQLLKCADGSRQDIYSSRNWLLELLLLSSQTSQTTVQSRINQNITLLISRRQRPHPKTLRQLLRWLLPLTTEQTPKHIASLWMQSRRYNLDTHSYFHPLYTKLFNFFSSKLTSPRWSLEGYPDKNGVPIPHWLHKPSSKKGQIRMPFLFTDHQTGRMLCCSVQSCHASNVGNKRRELAGKSRILSYTRGDQREWLTNKTLRKVLILDGNWKGPKHNIDKHVEFLVKAGWDDVLSPHHIDKVETIWRAHFAE